MPLNLGLQPGSMHYQLRSTAFSFPKGHSGMHCVRGMAGQLLMLTHGVLMVLYSVDHAMICHKGGLPTLRHNEIWDLTGELLSERSHCVSIEPKLQSLHNEEFRFHTANKEIWDLTGELLSERSHCVSIEPKLQSLHNEEFRFHTANKEDEARLDVQAKSGAKVRRPFLT